LHVTTFCEQFIWIDRWVLLTQNMLLAPSTQQAEQAGFTRAENHKTC
jgi:hypothetical protein